MPSDTWTGFSPGAIDFYRELERDNSKAFWEKHRAEFEQQVRVPMAELLDSLPDAYQPFKVFRPYRDVRFSTDKSPYKTQHGATHTTGDGAVFYVHLDATGLMAAAGMYQLARDQLARFRGAVDEPVAGGELERIVQTLADSGLEVGPGMEPPLRTAPRGFSQEHERIELLRWKGCITAARLGTDAAASPDARDWVLDVFEQSQPLVDWLERRVGPSQEWVERDRPR